MNNLKDRLGSKDDKGKALEESERYRGQVRTIFGGSVIDKSSKTARKKYAGQIYSLYQVNSTK